MTQILSIDIGTSSICTLAYQADTQRVLAVRSKANDAIIDGLPAAHHEQDPVRIFQICLELLAEVIADTAVDTTQVATIAVTGQMHGVVLVDEQAQAVSKLITWRDRRVPETDVCGCNDGSATGVAASVTGCHLHAGYGGTSLAWLARNGSLSGEVTALCIADYVVAQLCGVVGSEPTGAASWGIFDITKGQWHGPTIHCLGIPVSVLPNVYDSCRPVGRVHTRLAGQMGLPAEVAVCAAIGDNQASVIGAGGLNGDTAVMNLGTGGQISVPLAGPERVGDMEVRPMPFGGFIAVGASICGGWSYAYMRQFFQDVCAQIGHVEISDEQAYERMTRLAAQCRQTTDGLHIDTRFAGTRADTTVRGCISGIDTENLQTDTIARATLEGMVAELCQMVPSDVLTLTARIAAGGNAVRNNPLLVKIIEQQFARPCEVAVAAEEAATGAAIAAARGLELE